MLQTIKDVVLQMLPNIPQQHHQIQPPSYQDAFPSQQIFPTASFPSQNSLQTQSHSIPFPIVYRPSIPPQTNIHQPQSPTNIPSPLSQSFILPRSFNQSSSTPPNQLSPPLEYQITNRSESQHSECQSLFDNTIRAIDSEF